MKEIKLKVNSINPDSFNFLGDYLKTLGVSEKDIPSYTQGPRPGDEDDYNLLDNIDEALTMIRDYMENSGTTFLQVDSDVDGYTSSSIFYNYFKRRYPLNDIKWRLHNGKEHGVIVDTVPPDCGLVVIPDAGSMQTEEQMELSRQGKKVVILDHHLVETYTKYANVVLVNNQHSKRFTNKDLSGAGVVYEFIRAFDEKYYTDAEQIHAEYLDLAALGIIADMMNTRTLGNHYIITKGLSKINNKMFQELLIKDSYSIKDISHPTKIDIAFYIAPLINGLIRSGEQSEKESLFSAMIDNNNYRMIETTWRGTKRSETVYQYAARIAANAKSRQDAAKKKSILFLQNKIEKEGLDKNKVLLVRVFDKELNQINQNITGLAAMELVKLYNKPVLILREKHEGTATTYSGSGRSKEFNGLSGFSSFLKSTNLMDFVEGHENAFGASINEKNYEKFIEVSNNMLKDVDYNKEVIDVDYYFHDDTKINALMLKEFGLAINLYGAGIPQPKFAFDLNVNKEDVMIMGKDGTSLKIRKGKVDFVAFKNAELVKQLQENPSCVLTCVGRAQINEYMGYQNVQIIIDETEIRQPENVRPAFKEWF